MSQLDPTERDPDRDRGPEDEEGFPGWKVVGQKLRLLLWRAGAWLGAFTLFAVLLTGASGWYTSRPQFCNSCHIMEPYYVSWQESTHKEVTCTKCHFPPGVGEKVRGKLLGLVQLAQYVTSSAGPSPSAEIPDASCLRSGCHETRLLSGRVDFHGIPFDHAPHLGDLRRGKQLRCTSCHSQIVQGEHMTVTASTCYLCHFKNEFFNEGLGACTRCHQIPTEEYDLGGGVKFTHELAYEKGVDCASCHSDLIRGVGEVPVERCGVCHNREDDLKHIHDETLMHQVHVSDHHVDCLSCHLQIHHTRDPHHIASAASDCASCHTNPHQAQVAVLTGTGARSIADRLVGMAAVRITCVTCHTSKDVSSQGAVLMKASLQLCTSCHDAAAVTQLEAYHKELKDALAGLQPEVERLRDAVPTAGLAADRQTHLSTLLQDVEHDLTLLQKGNDIHNSHYASALAEALLNQLTAISQELQADAPEVTLPAKPDPPTAATESATTAPPPDQPPPDDAGPVAPSDTPPVDDSPPETSHEPMADATPADAAAEPALGSPASESPAAETSADATESHDAPATAAPDADRSAPPHETPTPNGSD